ncbi:MAG TPA: translation initiation factor IF-2 [Erysipelotrichaceae bacterium]|nr:translation initiation factor IF-2 [Erysipelotrichaceae bacterium]
MGRPVRRNNKKPRKGTTQREFKPRAELVTKIAYEEGITVSELAEKLNKNSSDLIKLLFMLGKMVTINSNLDDETVQLICMEYNVEVTKEEAVDEDSLEDIDIDDPKDLLERSPIITIMGHVDHGKTSLLDAIRKTKVVDGEHGGITQHIGAYQVTVNGKKLTFLDTPGHEAFTSMRARGAKVTDIVIIVVAADDGVMPQTREAIDHAKAAGVPIIVAINKIDKPGANFEKIYNALADLDLTPEEWGGEVMFCKLSAKTGEGIQNMLESILVVSEVQDLKANPNRMATGSVIEARLDKGRGPVATLLVQNGTLHAGDILVVGACFGKVRKMTDDRGREIKDAKPSMPVEIIGLNDVPVAGDIFKVFDNEKKARALADRRSQVKIDAERKGSSSVSLEELSKAIEDGNLQEINIIVKADVQGSAEAIKQALERIDVATVRINVIRSTVGAISESDIMLASASNAIVMGFNVRPDAVVRRKAEEEGIDIRLYNVIYDAVNEMESAMKGLLAPVYKEVVLGQASVRQLFRVTKVGTIAGCMVTDGKLVRDAKVRIIRDGTVVYTSKLGTLKRFQNDAKEVAAGYDCGLTIDGFNDIKENDVIEAFEDREVPQV